VDDLDKKLLSELQSKGYQKSSILVPYLGVAEKTIRRRINIMKSEGIIKIVAVPNPVVFGYKAWAKIGIKVKPSSLFQVAQELTGHRSIYFVAYSLGRFDIMIAVRFESVDRLTYFVNSELPKIKGILSTETMILMSPRKYYNFSWPAPALRKNNRSEHDASITYDAYQIDETDRKIINFLAEDGLTPIKVLKSRLGLGENTIRKRIKTMLKHRAFNIEVVPNPGASEYETWATMGVNTSAQFVHKVIDVIIKNPAVYLASDSIGRFNIIIAARFHNIDLLNGFVHMELAKIRGVGTVETFLHTKPVKYHNIEWSNLTKH